MPNERSFEEIIREHQGMVFRTLSRMTGQHDGLEDLAQDVFLRLFRALPGFRNEALVSTYLYRITVNVAQNEWKRRRADRRNVSISDEAAAWENRLMHPGQTPQQCVEQLSLRAQVDDALMELSGAERAVLVLYHQEEQSYQQIAEVLRMPLGTVRTHLHRGRRKLREAVERSER